MLKYIHFMYCRFECKEIMYILLKRKYLLLRGFFCPRYYVGCAGLYYTDQDLYPKIISFLSFAITALNVLLAFFSPHQLAGVTTMFIIQYFFVISLWYSEELILSLYLDKL